ncbi:unnamed protein product [Dicrocoelium dendriticum]|nr:unnamed protein product [Dicrocoelium dendriticum]
MDSVANPGCQTEQAASLACVVDAEMSTLYHQLDPQGTTIQWVRRTEHVAPNQKQLSSGFEITPNANHLNIAADTAVELVNSSMSSENVEQQNELQQPELPQPNGDAMEPSSSRESVKLIYGKYT